MAGAALDMRVTLRGIGVRCFFSAAWQCGILNLVTLLGGNMRLSIFAPPQVKWNKIDTLFVQPVLLPSIA
jgi:hypothetical protein